MIQTADHVTLEQKDKGTVLNTFPALPWQQGPNSSLVHPESAIGDHQA